MIQSKNIKQALKEEEFCITRFSGDSMQPFLDETTDELLITAIKSKPRIGDVILFKAKGCFLLHRIVAKSIFGYVTKGDNCKEADGRIKRCHVLGKLEGFWRDGQYQQVYKTEYCIRVANLDVKVLGSERVKSWYKDYVVSSDRNAELSLDASIPVNTDKFFDINTQPLGTEDNRLLTQFAYNAWKFGVLVLHSSVVLMDGKAYLFVGPSGIGKTTHAKLLKDTFNDEVTIINGDKALLRKIEGVTFAFGGPWAGRERINVNTSAPVGGVVILDRAGDSGSEIEKVSGPEVFNQLVRQIYMDLKDISNLDDVLALCNDLFSNVPIYCLKAVKSEAAAKLSYMTLTGKMAKEGLKQPVSDDEWEIDKDYEG